MNIIYWSDYACPFCYIGETHLKRALKNLGMEEKATIIMKAFELDPSAAKEVQGPTVDRFAAKYGLSMKAAQDRIESISGMGRDAGLDFHYAETRYTNTFDAHRLTKLAQGLGDEKQTDRLIERLYQAYFSESLELADHKVLKKIAVEEGLDPVLVDEVLSSDKFADEVRLDEREAQRYGVHAVPYFIIGGRVAIPGAMSIEEMEKVLKKVSDEEAASQAEEQGMTCGPDGCRIADHR